ncbi:MAG: leucine-rich repeat domain-containing protein, partial [Bacteroidales bacterium]|nr:leucine-rich repeat domain-containing protein [Bacteroidales bacterium]
MKRFLSLFLFTILFGGYAIAYDFSAVCSSGQTLYYSITSSSSYTVEVTYESNTDGIYNQDYNPIGNLVIPESVSYSGHTYSVIEIGYYAFCGCSELTSVVIPNSVTSIGSAAFKNCEGLTSITFSNSLTSSAVAAFSGCNGLTSVYYMGSIEDWCSITFNGAGSNSLEFAHNLYINDNLVTDLVIPSTVSEIKSYVFYGASCLASVTIPNSVTSIGADAFYRCSGLTEIVIPNSVTSIGNSAFYYCSELTSVTIGNSVTSIGNSAFYYCSELTSVTIGNSVTSIGNSAFTGCSGLTSIVIPNSVTNIASSAFSSCSGLTSVIIGNSVTSIEVLTFLGCGNLTTVVIGDSVASIGGSAFFGCRGLTDIYANPVIPPTIQTNAFNNYTATVHVPCGSAEAYRSATGWSNFSNISESNSYIASGTCGADDDNLTWTLSCDSVLTISGSGAMEDYSSTGAPWYGDYRSKIKTLVIDNGVTSIGVYAFYGCNGLTSVTIPNSVTSIGASAFYNCSGLTSVTIGNSVTSIGNYAFGNCSGLTIVNFNATNCTTMGSSISLVFNNCTSLSTLNIGENVTNIPADAFEGCSGLTSVTIPNSVTSIGGFAFNSCSGLTSVTIGTSVTSIGGSAFNSCSSLASVTIPNSVTSIGSSAFSGCSGLASVSIGNSVTSIGQSAFKDCSGLTSITIPSSVTSIGYSAFGNCSGLTIVNFNATNCTTMGSSSSPVFNNCTSLSTLNIGENVANIPAYSFHGCSGLTSVTIPNSVTSIGVQAFEYCNGLTTVNFNATNCTSMGSSSSPVFNNCTSLSTLNIGENVTNIPAYAFSGCSGLTSVTIDTSVTSIGNYAFRNCSGLSTVNFNATNCTTMGSSSYPAFYGCTSLATLNIGDNVTNIPNYAFSNCSGLTEITIPNSVTSIGYSAFYNCSGLTTINFNATNCTTMGDSNSSVFNGCTSFATLNIGESVTNIPAYAFRNCSGLTSVTIPNSVTSIGNYAFARCSGLAEVTIPTSITSIGNYAFQNCSGLTTITIPDSVASIGSYAFSGCSGLEDVRYNARNAQGGTSSSFPSNLHLIYLGDRVESIGNYMFYECTFLDSIVSAAVNPPAMNARTFYFVNIPNVPVIVPCRCVAAYEGADYWNNFNTVRQAFGCIQEYTITVVSANPDFGSVSGSGTYEQGTEVAISATPATHYHFVQWNDGNTDNPRTITVTADATYTAEFAIVQHTITALSANGTMGSVSGGGTYTEGTTATLTANANAGYRFSAWNDNNTDNPRIITVTGDAIFIATFKTLPQHTIAVLANNDTYGTVDGGGTFTEGTEIQISAVPNENYIFIQWNDGNTDNPRTITVTENVTYTAQFDVQHTIRYNATVEATGAWVENNTNTSRNTWDSNTGDGVLYLNSGVTTIGGSSSTNSSPFNNNTNLVSVDLDNSGLRSIGRFAFNNCSSLTSITIGKNITSVDAYSFDNCNGLSAVYYTGGVADWCEISFSNPANPLNYAHNLYINNNLVTDLVIPNTVTEIKQYAFQGATCLTTITIPSSVTSIGMDAFSGCNGLTAVYYTGDIAQWCGISFVSYYSNPLAYAHKLYINNELLTSLVIPEIITEIKDYAFNNASCLTSVTIPNSVTSIGQYAFFNCSRLSPITIGNSVANIGQRAFAGCYIYDIYANPITPPVFTNPDDSFSSYGYSATVYVPCGSEEAYRSADGWSNFTNIQERGTYTLDVTSANPQQGSANVTQQPNCSDGTALITATPIENFRFVHWNDGNTDNPRTIMVTQDTAFVAVFEEHPQYTITVHSANTSQGSVAGNGTFAEGTEVSISATAYEHNHFVSWNDGNTDNPRIITVTEDAMYIATFAIDQFTITVSANDYVMGTVS